MATVLSVGDIAIVQYNSSTTDSFTFVFSRDVEAGTVVNFTDNGWLAGGGFRPGEGTVTYTAPTAITAGTIVTLTGLDLDDAGDQIIAYQGDPASPTILYVVDLADGNSTVAGDATNDNTTALPPGFTLGVNAVAVGFDNATYAGPTDGSPPQLFPLISNSANWINSDALPPSFRYFYPPDIDLDSNNSTSGGDDYRAEFTSGGPPVRISDTDSDIDDFDSGFITFAQINIRSQQTGDVLSVNGALPFGIFASPYDPSTGIINLFGFASHADYQTAIEQIRFSTTAAVGTQKSIAVFVFDGIFWSDEATAFITVSGSPPVLDLDANNSNGGGADYTATFTRGGAEIPVADTDVSITDNGTTIQSARITLAINRQLGDELSAGALPPGITASSYNPFTGVITLSGAASLADYQTALRQVVFDTTSISTADRIIKVTVNDGTADSNVGTTYMHVVVPPPNVPPINTVPGAQSVAEDTILPIAGVSVADSDSSALTTTLSVANGILNVTAGAGVSGNGTASVTIAGTAAQINAALAGLAYTGNLDFNGGDALTVATSDGTAIDTDTIAITVNPVNDAPINTVPGAQSVAEDTILPIAGVSVADVDSSALTTTLSVANGILNVTAGAGVSGNGTASVTIAGTAAQINAALAGLAYTGNLDFNGADTLTVATSDGTAIDTDTIAITVNPVNDAPINTVPGAQSVAEDTILPIAGVSVADVDSSALTTTLSVANGILNVTAGAGVSGNGTASVTIAGTAAQINAALAGLAYTGNLDFNGPDTLTVATSDGTAIDTDTIAITVNPVNDAPALDLDANNSTTPGANYLTGFTDGGPAVAIVDTDVSVVDNDSPTLASATVTLTNPDTDDVLEFNGPAPGSIIVSGSGTSLIMLTGAASAAAYQTALQQITFDNTGATPSTATRVIDIVVNDGASNSNTAKAFIQVEVVNNSAPVLDLDPNDSGGSVRTTFRSAFTENGAPVPIADVDTSITDLDSTHLESATITLTNPKPGDLLTVSGVLPGTITPTAYDPGTGVLTLTRHATLDEYETALQQILYSSTSDDPVTEDRLIEVVVNDGANDSNVAAAVISVTATNDAPVITVDPSAAYVENAAPVLLSPSASLTDADDTELNFAAVQITDGSFPGDGDTLTVGGDPSGTGITFTWNPTLHALVFTGASSVANYQALLQTVQFQSMSDNPTDFGASPQRTLAWRVSDGTAVTAATTTLDITAVNDAPINTVPAAVQTVAEDTTLPIAGVSVADSDSSALTTTLSAAHGTLAVIAGAGVSGNGTASVTIAGTAAQINAALAGLAYTGNLDFNDPDTLTVATSDGTDTDTDTIAITVNPVNDAPINTVPGVQSVAEDTILPIAGVSVADIDSSALTTTLNVSSGTLAVSAGAGVSGNGTASVTIAGTAAQINAALAGLAYTGNLGFNGADTLTVATSDGTATDTDTIAIIVNPLNDAPALVVANATYQENAAAVLLSPSASLTDADNSALNFAAVQITAGSFPGDGDTLTVNGATSGTVTGITFLWDPTLHALVLTGASSPANYQALLQTVAFQSTSDNPTDFDASPQRTLTWFVSDGAAVTTTTTTLDITAVNDAPQETVAASAAYTESGSPVTISPAAVASDVDNSDLVFGVVRIVAGGFDGDVLTVNGLQSGTFAGIDFSYDAGLHRLVFGGPAAVADFQALMRAVGFGSTSENPTNFGANPTRTLGWGLSDGDDYSSPAQTTIVTITALNDAPINTVPGVQSVAEDTILPIAGVSVADVDSSALTTTLSVAHGTLDVIAGSGVSGNGTANVTLTGTAAQINATLAGASPLPATSTSTAPTPSRSRPATGPPSTPTPSRSPSIQ